MDILLFGSLEGAICILTSLAAKLGWCNGCSESGKENTDNHDAKENETDSGNNGKLANIQCPRCRMDILLP
jgi:hypothetical protein